MVPLGDLDVRNRVRIPSRTVKSKTSRAALTSVILAGFRRPNHEFACCGLMYSPPSSPNIWTAALHLVINLMGLASLIAHKSIQISQSHTNQGAPLLLGPTKPASYSPPGHSALESSTHVCVPE